MAIVTEISWDDMFDGKPVPDNPARRAWRDAVAEVAERAKAALPEAVNGRIEKAVAIVLAGDVELLADGKAKVASQSNGTTAYAVCNGTCECRDFPKAEGGWCKHRAAAAIHKRALPLAKAKLDTLNGSHAQTPSPPAPTQPQAPPAVPSTPLPEAPVSITLKATLNGHEVLVTLRGTDFTSVKAQVEQASQWLQDHGGQPAADTTPQCPKHGVSLTLQHGKDGRTWYSHKTAAGWRKGVRFVHPKLAV